jgi:Fe-S cluster assembly protein SufD
MVKEFERSHGAYLEAFERHHQVPGTPAWLKQLQQEAMNRFSELGFPSTRHEEWKYTNVAPIARQPFHIADSSPRGVSAKSLKSIRIPGLKGPRLVFIDGRFAEKFSSLGRLPKGVKIQNLAAAMNEDPEFIERHIARYVSFRENPFVSLNTALLQDGACILIGRNVTVRTPVHLLFLSSGEGEPGVSFPRNLIVAAEGSSLDLVEHYAGLNGGGYFTNAVTEIAQGENAVVNYYKIQEERRNAFHIATVQVRQSRSSRFSSHSISMGGALVRNDINAVLDGEGAECTLNGLYTLDGEQHEDNHTRIEHARPHCASHELYKGILDGNSTGVFNGKIYVHKDAQKTDAKQTNKNLLRSENASINTKPQLEIFADDVKCTHGATIGQLDEEAVFYLRARGIGEEEARNLLTCAFARDIIGRVKIEAIRMKLETDLMRRLEGQPA